MRAASAPASRFSTWAGDAPNGRCANGQPSSVRNSEPGGDVMPSVRAAIENEPDSHHVIVGYAVRQKTAAEIPITTTAPAFRGRRSQRLNRRATNAELMGETPSAGRPQSSQIRAVRASITVLRHFGTERIINA